MYALYIRMLVNTNMKLILRAFVLIALPGLTICQEVAQTNSTDLFFGRRYQGQGLYLEVFTTNGIPFTGRELVTSNAVQNTVWSINVLNGFTNGVFLSLEPSLLTRRGIRVTCYGKDGERIAITSVGGRSPMVIRETFVYLQPVTVDRGTRSLRAYAENVMTFQRPLEMRAPPAGTARIEIVGPIDLAFYVCGDPARHEEQVDLKITVLQER
jgi:hypothetical protein